MTARESDDDELLGRLCDALAESVVDLPDSEVLAEAREAGEDPSAVADEMRAAALDTLKFVRQSKLHAARTEYQLQHSELATRLARLPATAGARRQLLSSALSRRPELGELVTLAARDLRTLPDEDVESLLRQLDALGALPAAPTGDSGGGGD